MQLVDVPIPRPAAGQVLLKVAAGVNYADIWQRKSSTPTPLTLPCMPSYEAAGTIEALGEGVTTAPVGQQVMAMLPSGGYAAYVVAPAAQLIPLPETLVYAEARGGSLLVQVAKNRGLHVIAAVGSEAKKTAG